MKNRFGTLLILFFIIGIPVAFTIIMKCGRTVYHSLPYLGPVKGVTADGDTIYHTIAPFEFTDQQGHKVSNDDLKGCIYVADFFFASCPDICPRMNANLSVVYDRFKDNPKVKFISFTIDPDHDTTEVLLKYAKQHTTDNSKWYFLRGDKDSIYRLAKESFLVQAGEGDAKPVSFQHESTLVLVDYNGHIRAKIDGLDPSKMDEMKDAIQLLLTEQKTRK
jgi:protein SCO1/2